MLQHIVEVDFRVDSLRASLYRSHDGHERELGHVSLDQFSITFIMAKYTMAVDVNLGYCSHHYLPTYTHDGVILGPCLWTLSRPEKSPSSSSLQLR